MNINVYAFKKHIHYFIFIRYEYILTVLTLILMHKIILLIQMYACCSFFPFSLWFNRFEKNVCVMNDWNAKG